MSPGAGDAEVSVYQRGRTDGLFDALERPDRVESHALIARQLAFDEEGFRTWLAGLADWTAKEDRQMLQPAYWRGYLDGLESARGGKW